MTLSAIVTAKALTSGYFPLGAVLVGRRLMEMLEGSPFRHGFTYNGHPVGAAVAMVNLDIIEREGLLERALQIGQHLLDGLQPLEAIDSVAEVRGVGLMLGIELAGGDAAAVQAGCRRRGVIVRATGQKIVMSPPLVIKREHVDRMVESVSEEMRRL
jgi:adenosylmethionine-8-amino-7-oxononanoate aminotransferase